MVDAKNDLIFFKSAYNDIYRKRILTILSLPEGYFYETDYRRKYVSDAVWYEAEHNPTQCKDRKGILVFADLFAKETSFYPLREVTLHHVKCEGDFLKIGLKIGGYFEYDEEGLNAFNRQLKKSAGDLPETGKGKYAQFCDVAIVSKDLRIKADSSAWVKLVDDLSEKADPKNFEKSVFFWFSLVDDQGRKPELSEFKDELRFILISGKRYVFDFLYYAPNYDKLDKTDLNISFNLNDYCFETSSKSLVIPSTTKNTTEKLNFHVEK